jgi:hypothetical protein
MISARTSVIALFCLALLGIQLSGSHLHVNLQGDSGGLHGSHVHDSHSDGHDHSADVDVSVLELGTIWSKVITFLVPIAMMLLGIVWVIQTIWPAPRPRLSLLRRTRWRPPLRAPPLSP